MSLVDHHSLNVWAEFPVSWENLDPNKLKNFIINLSLSSYLHSYTHIQKELWWRAWSFAGANEGQMLPDAFNQKSIGFQIHPRVICVAFLASVMLHIFLHAKLHQTANESKQAK